MALNFVSSLVTPEFPDHQVTLTPLLATDEQCIQKMIGSDDLNLSDTEGCLKGSFVIGALAEKKDSKLALFTSDSFIRDTGIGTLKNLDFVFNTLSYLGEQKESISIAPKLLLPDRLEIQSDLQKVILSSIVLYVIPLMVLSVGLLRWFKRKKL